MDQIHVMITNFIYHDDFLNSNIEDKKLSKEFISDINSILEKLLNSDNQIENINKIIFIEYFAKEILNISFEKNIKKYEFILDNINGQFYLKNLEIIFKDLEKRIFNLNEKQLKELKQLKNEFPKDSKNMNLSILQENCKKFLDIYYSDK